MNSRTSPFFARSFRPSVKPPLKNHVMIFAAFSKSFRIGTDQFQFIHTDRIIPVLAGADQIFISFNWSSYNIDMHLLAGLWECSTTGRFHCTEQANHRHGGADNPDTFSQTPAPCNQENIVLRPCHIYLRIARR